jgi:hypothetical protein
MVGTSQPLAGQLSLASRTPLRNLEQEHLSSRYRTHSSEQSGEGSVPDTGGTDRRVQYVRTLEVHAWLRPAIQPPCPTFSRLTSLARLARAGQEPPGRVVGAAATSRRDARESLPGHPRPDPSGRSGWAMRSKPTMNAFAITPPRAGSTRPDLDIRSGQIHRLPRVAHLIHLAGARPYSSTRDWVGKPLVAVPVVTAQAVTAKSFSRAVRSSPVPGAVRRSAILTSACATQG